MGAIQTLKSLYQNRKKWVELVATLEREIKSTTEPQKKSSLYLEISEIFSEKLVDHRMALEYLQNAMPSQA